MATHTAETQRYINRELSWLEFNQRVLDQARLPETPLLERLKFLAITASNLDEFFMVRVGGLKIQARISPDRTDILGLDADHQLNQIRQRVLSMYGDQYTCLNEELLPELATQEIRRLSIGELSVSQREHLKRFFEEEILSVISPIAVEDGSDFPLMTSAALGLCVRTRGKSLVRVGEDSLDDSVPRFILITIPRILPRMLSVPSTSGFHFVLLEDVVAHFAFSILPGQEIDECVTFRATRNADVTVDEEGASDLLADMQELLDARKTADCVRLEISSDASSEMCQFLSSCLKIESDDVFHVSGPLDLSAFMSLATSPGFNELKFEPWPAQPSADFPHGEDIFEVVAAEDRVLIHPFESYDPVVDFLRTAASDPHVIAIKQTLYRTSDNSAIVAALHDAAETGKHVTVILELKARFDEQQNIDWAKKLEKAGVDVIYGVKRLKTHAKICLIVRRESNGIRRYMHFGTGNYNESTARIYSDISFFTCDPQLGIDAVNLFNAVTGLSIPQPMQKLIAAPIALRQRLLELIEVEIENSNNQRPAAIRAKVNSLVDDKIIDALYQASQAGVNIELNVRGICCLRPGIPGLSENIRVVSIVDRLLEHARIFYFLHGGDHRVFTSSADWMGRNLDRRVELMVPIENPKCKKKLIDALNCYLSDNVKAQQLLPDASYQPVSIDKQLPMRSQQMLYSQACQSHQEQTQSSRTTFQPHRASNESA